MVQVAFRPWIAVVRFLFEVEPGSVGPSCWWNTHATEYAPCQYLYALHPIRSLKKDAATRLQPIIISRCGNRQNAQAAPGISEFTPSYCRMPGSSAACRRSVYRPVCPLESTSSDAVDFTPEQIEIAQTYSSKRQSPVQNASLFFGKQSVRTRDLETLVRGNQIHLRTRRATLTRCPNTTAAADGLRAASPETS